MKDCIEWTGEKDSQGFGRTLRDGKVYLAHRLVWMDRYGEIPEGRPIRHKCGNRGCVNIEHLFLGSKPRLKKGNIGSNHPRSKLTEADIPEIRRRLLDGDTQKSIAKSYGVAQEVISKINRGKCWAHV